MRLFTLLLACLALGTVATLAACGGDDEPAFTPGDFDDVTSVADATVTATPEPVSEQDASAVFAVEEALRSQDSESIRPLIGYRKIGCVETAQLGGPPVCASGENEGDLVDAFYYGTCEGEYVRPEGINEALGILETLEVQSAFRLPNRTEQGYQYAIVLLDHGELRDGMAWEAIVDQGQIVGLVFSCSLSPEELIAARNYRVPVPTPGPTAATTPAA